MTDNTAIALYQGVEVQQAAYMAAFSQPDGMASIIRQICEQAQNQAAEAGTDMDKAANRKQLASIAYAVAKAKTAIDGTGKDLVAEAKAKIKIVDDNRKAVRDQLGELQEQIRRPHRAVRKAARCRWVTLTTTYRSNPTRRTSGFFYTRKEHHHG